MAQNTSPELSHLDHLVLTVRNIEASIAFYRSALGMQAERFQPSDGTTRWALKFGAMKINLHQLGREFEPKAAQVAAGSADLCFLSAAPLERWITHLQVLNIEIEQGPVARTGALGPIRSIYLRDPDGNLIELSNKV